MKYFQTLLLFIVITIIGIVAYKTFLAAEKKTHEKTTEEQVLQARQTIIAQQTLQDPQRAVLASCTGEVSTTKTPDGKYALTGFGCYIEADGKTRNDDDTPGRCGLAYCSGNPPPECAGMNSEDCMYNLRWFAANQAQYGCGTRLKVTNPANGKAVVVVVYDSGPHCNQVNIHGEIIDLSYPAVYALSDDGKSGGNYETVQVEVVPPGTKLGPTDGSASIPEGATGGSTGGGSFTLGLTLKPKTDTKDTYVVNMAQAVAYGEGQTNSPGSVSPGGGTLPNDPTGLVKTAQDVMAAFQQCQPPGTTFSQSGLDSCLQSALKKSGYSDQQVNALIARRPSSAVPLSIGGTPCSQCLGYVGITLALWLGTSDGNQTLGASGMGTAGSLNTAPYGPSGFPVGNGRYVPIGTGANAKIQPGDIAVAGTPYNGDHIGIVYKVADSTHMFLIESNGGLDCKITNDRGPVAKDAYTFYRKQ